MSGPGRVWVHSPFAYKAIPGQSKVGGRLQHVRAAGYDSGGDRRVVADGEVVALVQDPFVQAAASGTLTACRGERGPGWVMGIRISSESPLTHLSGCACGPTPTQQAALARRNSRHNVRSVLRPPLAPTRDAPKF